MNTCAYGLAVLLSMSAVSSADELPQASNPVVVLESPQASERTESPPTHYRRGAALRKAGKDEEAAGYFLAAAQRGYHLAEVELAYLHAEEGSILRDDPAAYAWFTLAIKHEPQPTQARILSKDREVVRHRMRSAEKNEARRLSDVLLSNLGAVPTYTEAK